jgi:hypothetical protein
MLSSSQSASDAIIQALADQVPFAQLPGTRAANVAESRPFDVRFDLESGANIVRVYAEVKQSFSPRELENIAPWIARLKAVEKDAAFAVVSPVLSQQAQNFCIEAGIDFLDLAGNISINVPGKFVLQRTGQRSKSLVESSDGPREVNVFSGRISRVLRVLLQQPRTWTLTEIASELDRQSNANPIISEAASGQQKELNFRISLGSISKALASLEEQLLIRRRNSAALVPEPERLLRVWADKYRERYRWRLRQSFRLKKPLGKKLNAVSRVLREAGLKSFAITGSAAASLRAPFVDIETVDIFLPCLSAARLTTEQLPPAAEGPVVRFIEPYDLGVFLYAAIEDGIPVVSNIQAYLDLYARGGRDQKQADYLFQKTIEPMWKAE